MQSLKEWLDYLLDVSVSLKFFKLLLRLSITFVIQTPFNVGIYDALFWPAVKIADGNQQTFLLSNF